jgi:hypothetical protein
MASAKAVVSKYHMELVKGKMEKRRPGRKAKSISLRTLQPIIRF